MTIYWLFACSGPDKRQCKDCWIRPLWSQGHNFNNLVEIHWQIIKALDVDVLDKMCVFVFPI